MKRAHVISLVSFFSFIAIAGFALAEGNADLDDGISKFNEDKIEKEEELGKPDQNIKFIVMNAKSKAARIKGNKDDVAGQTGGANMNSVVMGAGSKVKGDIYIIDNSKGPKTNVSE